MSAVSPKLNTSRDKENKMAKYVVEVFNLVSFEDEGCDGKMFIDTRIEDVVSLFFTKKIDAEAFIANSSHTEKHLTKVDSTCGCLEDGDDVELMMNFGDNTCAYCYDCS
jgi:hypothetical protein